MSVDTALDRVLVGGVSRSISVSNNTDTLGLGPEVWRVLSKCHDMRNRTEYEGALDVDDRLVADLIDGCLNVAEQVGQLPPVPQRAMCIGVSFVGITDLHAVTSLRLQRTAAGGYEYAEVLLAHLESLK